MGWGSFDPRDLRRMGHASKSGRISNADFNRFKRGVYARQSAKIVTEIVGDKQVADAFSAIDEKIRLKVIQNAIKPIVRQARDVWKREIKQAKVSGRNNAFRRRYGGTSMRAALSKSLRAKNPSGRGEKSLRGYVSIGGFGGSTTKHGKRGEAVTNAGQMMWLEWGTKPHALGGGRQHPGTEPVTHVRAAMQRLKPRAKRVFEEAIRAGIKSGGESKISAKQGRAMFARANK